MGFFGFWIIFAIIPNSSQADAADAKAMLVGDEIHYATGMFCMDAPESVEIFRHEVQHYIQQKKGQVESTNLSANQNPALEKSAENAEKGDFKKGTEGTNTLTNEEIAQHKPTKPFDLNAPTAKSPTSTKKLYVYGTDAIIVDSTTNEAWYLENADRNVHSLQHFEENRTAWTPFSAEDYKVCKMTPPANLSATATPPETDTSTQKSEYWTKELIAPFAKVLAPEQMAELRSLLDAIHPNKQNQDATLTASSNQMLALPLFPLVVPAIIAAAEGLWFGYTAVVVAVEVSTVVVASVVVAEIIKEMLSVDLPEVVVEAERSKPTVVPTPTGTDFKGWLPWSIYIPKETSKPQGEKSKSEKPKSEKPKAKRPKKDPKKPSGDGLLPSIGLGGMIANELHKNQNKQETPTAELTPLEEQELKELNERAKTKKLSIREQGRKESLELKKQQPAQETEESLRAKIEETEANGNLTPAEREKLLSELRAKLAILLRKSKEPTDYPMDGPLYGEEGFVESADDGPQKYHIPIGTPEEVAHMNEELQLRDPRHIDIGGGGKYKKALNFTTGDAPNQVKGMAHKTLKLVDAASVDLVTIESAPYSDKILEEVARVLKKGGILRIKTAQENFDEPEETETLLVHIPNQFGFEIYEETQFEEDDEYSKLKMLYKQINYLKK